VAVAAVREVDAEGHSDRVVNLGDERRIGDFDGRPKAAAELRVEAVIVAVAGRIIGMQKDEVRVGLQLRSVLGVVVGVLDRRPRLRLGCKRKDGRRRYTSADKDLTSSHNPLPIRIESITLW